MGKESGNNPVDIDMPQQPGRIVVLAALFSMLTACASSGSAPRANEVGRSCPPGQMMICHSRSGETERKPPEERTYDYCRCRPDGY